MRVSLNFINKYQRIVLFFHLSAEEHTYLKVEIFDRFCVCKKTCAERILDHVYFNKVFKKLFSDVMDNVRLADLTRAVYQKNFL